jgi:hypothetical protein
MAMSDQDSVQRKLRIEWFAALATVVGGLVIAVCVAAYLTYGEKPAVQAGAGPQVLTPAQVQRQRTIAYIKMANQLCQLELANAKNFGIVPNYGRLASPPLPRATDVRGRYVCIATTGVAKYTLAGDLVCKNLRDSRCVSLFSVSQDDGTVLYQRQG